MLPVQAVPLAALGSTAPIVCDYRNSFGTTTLSVVLSPAAALTYKVQYTTDDVFAPTFNPTTANWFDHPTMVGQTTSGVSNMAAPPTAVRLTTTAYTSGSAALKVISNNGLLG